MPTNIELFPKNANKISGSLNDEGFVANTLIQSEPVNKAFRGVSLITCGLIQYLESLNNTQVYPPLISTTLDYNSSLENANSYFSEALPLIKVNTSANSDYASALGVEASSYDYSSLNKKFMANNEDESAEELEYAILNRDYFKVRQVSGADNSLVINTDTIRNELPHETNKGTVTIDVGGTSENITTQTTNIQYKQDENCMWLLNIQHGSSNQFCNSVTIHNDLVYSSVPSTANSASYWFTLSTYSSSGNGITYSVCLSNSSNKLAVTIKKPQTTLETTISFIVKIYKLMTI